MKDLLRKLNDKLTGFRGILSIWIPIGAAYGDAVFSNLTGLSKAGVLAAAQLAIIPTVKLIWTDAIPKMKALYDNWLAKP